MRFCRRPFLLALAVLLFLPGLQAETKPLIRTLDPPPQSLLWVGNSFFYYNNSLHNHFGQLVAAAGKRVRGISSTISGAGLDWHDMASLLRPQGLGRYTIGRNNEVRFHPESRTFDAAIMMDCSQCPIHPQLQADFHAAVRKQSQLLKQQGVRPVLFMSWSYKDKPEMGAQLAEQYTLAGNANEALVIPAGLAFARVMAAHPTIDLYTADLRHPSLAGTYLAACTAYAALYGQSPQGLNYTAGLDPATAEVLQQAAWAAVVSFFAP